MHSNRLSKKVAIVTGGAQGIGFAIAKLFHDQGASVVITDMNEVKGRAAKDLIGERCDFFLQDVSIENSWKDLFVFCEKRFGFVNILVNNAGISGLGFGFGPQDPENTTLSDWKKVHAVNAEGTFLGCKYAIQHMKNRGGSIVNISSRSANVGVPTMSAYASSKASIRNHTKSVALYCCQNGYPIRCNSVHPAAIKTPFWDPMFTQNEEKEKATARSIPMGHMGEPLDVAYAVLYLASDESKFVTGSELVVDGGILAGSQAAPGVIHLKENL